ncbi:hypothetical protein M569_13179 [Genlisea aurea]|uniref:Uncharacterized protein n=1 Tax=Genlisea aurea TaxID=192259 RepID=S8CB58_9LAMI|nr:hypothetical protein M569_13179 [Genlisea aurea]
MKLQTFYSRENENESRAVVIRNAAAAVADDDAKRPVSDDKKQHPDCVVARLNVLKLREVAEGGRGGGGGGCWDWEHVGEDDEF